MTVIQAQKQLIFLKRNRNIAVPLFLFVVLPFDLAYYVMVKRSFAADDKDDKDDKIFKKKY